MANWVRLWEDMPNDPKWRVIARRSGRPIAEVIAVFVHMMTNAGANATERGVLDNWSDEDVAAALDIEPEHVAGIRDAMQDKTLDGERLKGWEKRQPKREDGAAERAREWRERRKAKPNSGNQQETQPNATERNRTPDKRREEKIREDATLLGGRARELYDAAGITDETKSPSLLVLSEPMHWLSSGCDMDADILPTLKSLAARKPVKNWRYCAEAVFEARDRRLAPAPAVQARSAGPPLRQRRESFSDVVREWENDEGRRKIQGNSGDVGLLPPIRR